ncbi:DUF4424 domain-containing protein [Phyllobacterium sp. 628]|uniref:DUF4424 domain-containing protein n=1 Tax=Phyllobacterium sp. 628 TaxID=2718938 RepID=UPI001FCEDF53|nr:DUF4424 domain-containing protein [Phyllobacterium sp. 628]
MLKRLCLSALLALFAQPSLSLANDTSASLSTGGLVFLRSQDIWMQQEDLFISEKQVRVDYIFKNSAKVDVESIVAFPMPDMVAENDSMISIPHRESDNFLDFTVTADGQPITPTLQQRAATDGLDVTDILAGKGIPVSPFDSKVGAAINALDDQTKEDWISRGLLIESSESTDGKVIFNPGWTLKSTFWWSMKFPAGKELRVSHRYKPSVGGGVGLRFDPTGKAPMADDAEHTRKYCRDKDFNQTVAKIVEKEPPNSYPLYENWISYVLTTGANWAGSIQKFKLTIDKGDPDTLISFCGKNVRKTGPTTFEMTAENFLPQEDLNILLLERK